MTELRFINLLVLPAALGLLGVVEPCSIGSSLIGFGLFVTLPEPA